MRKVFIKYDPYEMKSTVVVDGKEIQKNRHCDSNLKKYLDGNIHIPIQSWIDPIDRENWSGLLKVLCDMGDKDIIIEGLDGLGDITIKADKDLIYRAVYNLVDNAIRHMGDDQKVIISVKNGDRVMLEVEDHGAGIDAMELPHIWEKYYTSRQRGNKGVSGLGLAIVKEIAEIHGAEYGASSEKGRGSRFWMAMKKQ